MANEQALMFEIRQRLKQALPATGIRVVAMDDKADEHAEGNERQQTNYRSDAM
jgi:hypothetical protein